MKEYFEKHKYEIIDYLMKLYAEQENLKIEYTIETKEKENERATKK